MLLQLAVGVIVAYGGIVGVMYLAQRSLMYVPDLARVSPAAAGLPQAEEITLTTADSERLVAWHVAPQSDRPVILYLQGNGGALRHRVLTASRSSCSTVWACLPYPTAGSAARLVRRARLDFCSMPRPRMRSARTTTPPSGSWSGANRSVRASPWRWRATTWSNG
jgi:hypothetical protein